MKRLAPAYGLVLTGTPMENRLEELASIVEWVDDRALEPKWRLTPWHSAHGDGRREVVGARNLGELRARLAPVLLRRTRAEVLGQSGAVCGFALVEIGARVVKTRPRDRRFLRGQRPERGLVEAVAKVHTVFTELGLDGGGPAFMARVVACV